MRHCLDMLLPPAGSGIFDALDMTAGLLAGKGYPACAGWSKLHQQLKMEQAHKQKAWREDKGQRKVGFDDAGGWTAKRAVRSVS